MKIVFNLAFYIGLLTIIFPIVAMLYFQTVEQIFVITLIIGIGTTIFTKLLSKKIPVN